MEKIKTGRVSLNVADGTSMSVYVAQPDTEKKLPGIMVFQEAFGVNGHIRDITERFAREGFIAAAPELFHRTVQGFEGSYKNFEEVRPYVQSLTVEGLDNDIKAVYDWFRKSPYLLNDELACIGFCMGGRVSYLCNTLVKVKAAVSFYGGGIAAALDRASAMQAPHLFFWGGLDKHIGKDQREAVADALTQHGKTFASVVFSKADHGFFCDARASYNPDSAKQAWALVKSFLGTYIKSE